MRNQLFFGAAIAALVMPAAASAQSTGSMEFDEGDIVVKARTEKGIAGIESPDTSKAKGVLNQEFISRQTPGNSILNTINSLPGVSFQNNDPFGSAGGTLNIRGFDSSRIALTFDGIPLNDSGNYAIFSNQQLDPELIENVNVNYGSTDVDTPSAAASGSTVNYRTRNPSEQLGARFLASVGDFNYYRFFGMIDTGNITSFGTRLFVAASRTENNWYLNDFGKIFKQQYNAKLYQPIGDNGDFVSVSGNYNQNRNNFGGSAPLRSDNNIFSQSTAAPNSIGNPALVTGAVRTPGTNSNGNRFPNGFNELPYTVPRCTLTAARTGLTDTPFAPAAPLQGCGTSFDERFNPSNTGNVRINSRFTLADRLVLTVDPSYQYVKANGGGTVAGSEGTGTLAGVRPAGSITTGYVGTVVTAINTGAGQTATTNFFGRDLNGDGDVLDTVTVLRPSQTQTSRFGVLASLRWDVSDDHSVRVTYSFDRARHRQTGEAGFLRANGQPFDVFPVNAPILTSAGTVLQGRDRLSFATLHQVSGEYRGKFFDEALVVTAGIRAPFYSRDLTQNCFTTAASGNVACTNQTAAFAAANPYSFNATTNTATGFAPPQSRSFNYQRVLPNVGFVFKPADGWSVFGNYSKGLQVPSTDNLYQNFYFPLSSPSGQPEPETTDNFDAGLRYNSSKLQVQVGPYFSRFTNRLANAFDPDTQVTLFRNLGTVDKYGFDGSVTYRPIPELTLYVFGSYLDSNIQSNVQIGRCPTTLTAANTTVNCTVAGAPIFALTAGRRESGAPVYTVGGRVQGQLGPVEIGIQVKRTGPRFLNDQNLPALQCTGTVINQVCPTAANTPGTFTGTRGFAVQTFDASTPAYTLIDADVRLPMGWAGLNDKTYLQLNVQNLANQYFVGGFNGGSTTQFNNPFAQIGTPRTFIMTLNVGF